MARRPTDVQDGSGLFDPGPYESDPYDSDLGEEGNATPAPVRRTDRRLIVEADGGSRGNPGPAAYGALVCDATTDEVLLSEGLAIGRATNNVAEYRGLIAGLEMAREIDPGARVEIRMDSKLVIEQMAGRWKIKHPDMKPLAMQASKLRPVEAVWTWVPRALNKRADALVNRALDGEPVPRR